MYGIMNMFQEGNRIWHRKYFGDPAISQWRVRRLLKSEHIFSEGHRAARPAFVTQHGSSTVSTRHKLIPADIPEIIPSSVTSAFTHVVVPKTSNTETMFLKKPRGSSQCLPPLFKILPQGTSINIKTLIKESISDGTSEWGDPVLSDDVNSEYSWAGSKAGGC